MKAGIHQTVLGAVLKAWRERAGWNVREAADIIGISHSTLCRLENGETTPDAKTLLAILNWLLRAPDGE